MSSSVQSFPRMLKMLRENGTAKEKCEALTYIRSHGKKLQSAGVIKEEQYKEICKLVIDTFTNRDVNVQHEAYETLNIIIHCFKDHTLNLFEAMLRTSRKDRLKILKLLEVVEDNAILMASNDVQAINFFNDCMRSVDPTLMEWIAPTACTDNILMLTEAENRQLSDVQRIEEEMISYAIMLLRRLYKFANITFDDKIQRFDTLVMDKVMVLAYMGHKRQRGPALKVLQQAVTTNIASHIRTDFPDAWNRYKSTLQSIYCKRMLLLVGGCEMDWATQWNVSIQFLGTDLHRGAGLINNLLSVEERAFKSTDTIIRRQAFLSWKLLVDNFALDPQELATARRIKLLCIPLNAKNSKTELIALTKLEVWWHLIIKLYKDIAKFVNPVITQFLNFCFGPLGDTPLLSSKFDVVFSPGKRFFKTKVVAVDALCQLLVTKHENHTVFSPILEERLPHAITDPVFQESYKSIIHSVGEALLILGQLTDTEMKNRYSLGKILWTSLINYVQESKIESKEPVYKDIILVVTELLDHATDKSMVKEIIHNVILLEFNNISKHFNFQDDTVSKLVIKLLSGPIFSDMTKNHLDALRSLVWQCIKPRTEKTYCSNSLKFMGTILEKLKLYAVEHNASAVAELWNVLAEVLVKYMENSQEINECNTTGSNFETVNSILIFPFTYIFLQDPLQVQGLAKIWKSLYKHFEEKADLIPSITSNEILLGTAKALQNCLHKNKASCSLIIHCLDALLSTIDYKCLVAQDEIPSIVTLIVDLILSSMKSTHGTECESALKALSAVLITVYGHDSRKVVTYLQACKPAVELMLTSESKTLYKEIANTWETVISIFKGLNQSVNYDLLSSYKNAIIHAFNHPNMDINIQAISVLDIHDVVNNSARCILEELEKEVKKDNVHIKFENIKKKKEDTGKLTKAVKVVGSFLNKKSECTVPKFKKQGEKVEKRPISPEPDSQDYVFIKTDLKFDVNRLTEHQKETLKRKREDIPALYNDLSQSSSQDTQHLQEWFDIKNKRIEETDKASNKKSDELVMDILDHDANKENKIEIVSELADKALSVNNDSKSVEVEQNVSTVPSAMDDTRKHDNVATDAHEERCEAEKDSQLQNDEVATTVTPITSKMFTTTEQNTETKDIVESSEFVAKRLNFESHEEFPENRSNEKESSPSVLDSGRRRSRNNAIKASLVQTKAEESANNSSEPSTGQIVQRTLRTKVIQGKSVSSLRQKTSDTVGKDKLTVGIRRGVKRKSASDSESEGMNQRRRRKLTTTSEIPSDNESVKSTESDNLGMHTDGSSESGSVSQRTKNEISRLQINMVFDSPLPNRRRSKTQEEGNKEINVKNQNSPGNMGFRLRSADGKFLNTGKRGSKIVEKQSKLSTGQRTMTRRRKKSLKDENKKFEESHESQDTQQAVSSVESGVEPNNSENTDASKVECSPTILMKSKPDVQPNALENDEIYKDISPPESNEKETSEPEVNETDKSEQPPMPLQETSQSQDESGDIVESSQQSSICFKLEKKYNEKQCFIKINKIGDTYVSKQSEPTSPKNVSNLVSDNSVNKNDEVPTNDNTQHQPLESVNPGTIEPSENTQQEEDKNSSSDIQKVVDVSPSSKTASIINFSSPKTNASRYIKLKVFPGQGRAAHMLGLVTKQGRVESDNQNVKCDEEVMNKRLKSKDLDNEVVAGKKERIPMLKEVDKIGGPCGSRQEKIFSNMRSTDYCSSPPLKLFSNLKNDGEKISSKLDKTITDYTLTHGDGQVEKENEGSISPSFQKDELPMLEWSSANPPSLTASPSASILKRHRQSVPEPDPDVTTPNKRKRVSFADPPVSKEMGYETANVSSPHKVNKFSTSRGLTPRKDSPLRPKQTKLKTIYIDSNKMNKDDKALMANTSDVDLQCERDNEILTKIAEELEYTENMSMDVDPHTSCSFMDSEDIIEAPEANSCSKVMLDNLTLEVEIAEDSVITKNVGPMCVDESTLKDKASCVAAASMKEIEEEDLETQEDIFAHVNPKKDDLQRNNESIVSHNSSVQHSTPDTLKLNVTNDSVLDSLPQKDLNLESLDDTVDAANLTTLNSTANSDEIFCGKLMRTSTHAAENVEEQDTLPATDSVFASLPLSQESMSSTQSTAEIPELEHLDSTLPIYPLLTNCQEPIKSIVAQLTNPLWIQHLSAYFANRGLHTVGDLAQLSERAVNRIPVKGNPKIDFVKSVLENFAKTNVSCASIKQKKQNDDAMNSSHGSSTSAMVSQDNNTTSTKGQKESPNHSTPLAQADKVLDTGSNDPSSTVPNQLMECSTNDDPSSTETSSESKVPKVVIPMTQDVSFSPNHQNSSTTFTLSTSTSTFNLTDLTRMFSKPVSSVKEKMNKSDSSLETSNVCVSINPNNSMQATKIVGVCTTPVSTSKALVKKASKSVGSQMALEDLLDEIDVNLVLQSAVRRSSAENILTQYKNKMKHMSETELEKETVRMLGLHNKMNNNEVTLKTACRACGVNKVLLRLPDIFGADKQFFVKVLNAYRKKIKVTDCLNILDFSEIKDAICQKCTSSELAEMLSKKLKEEEQQGIREPMTELSSLNAMLKRVPMDVIISHTVANDELIPSRVVLDIALQNNSPDNIARALESQSVVITKSIFDKLWSSQLAVEHIKNSDESKESLLGIFKAISSKLSEQELLDAYHQSMKAKLITEDTNE
ncbi:hypothetical protein KM043_016334 [Ampulex compressa]|nr:hypothetical protein KM043_016334 [Ampulex compressa]